MTTNNMHTVFEKDAWSDQMHADVFDYLNKMPKYIVKKHYEGFNECRLLKLFKDDIQGNIFFEIGCATGELYRYISKYMRRFQYFGFDISEPAIARAKEKFPHGRFHLLSSGFDEIREIYGRPEIIWCRDVIMHQNAPYVFLSELINLSREVIVLRLRTRDVGDTVFDSQNSCQLHWDKFWVPYIVLNTDEMIHKIKDHENIKKIVVSRHYEVLGGHNYRFLPKELYFTDARTAETAVFIQKSSDINGPAEVLFMDQKDRPRYGIIDRVVRKAFSILKTN